MEQILCKEIEQYGKKDMLNAIIQIHLNTKLNTKIEIHNSKNTSHIDTCVQIYVCILNRARYRIIFYCTLEIDNAFLSCLVLEKS